MKSQSMNESRQKLNQVMSQNDSFFQTFGALDDQVLNFIIPSAWYPTFFEKSLQRMSPSSVQTNC